MKQALIIGGTQGFGKEMTEQLRTRGYATRTVGRSSSGNYQCDILDNRAWRDTLHKISEEIPQLDVLVCVPGFAKAKNAHELTEDDWFTTHQGNLGYIIQAVNELGPNLDATQDHRVITLGSRWSFRSDCELLLPYIQAKHKLVEVVKTISARQHISCYCVPPMDTPGLTAVVESFQDTGMGSFTVPGTANVEGVVETILEHNLPRKGSSNAVSGKSYVIELDGKISRSF